MFPKRSASTFLIVSVLTLMSSLFCASAQDLATRGLREFQAHQFSSAERTFLQLTEQEPNDAGAWKLLGMTYVAQEKYKQAETAFQRSYRLNSDDSGTSYYLGRTQFTLGRFDQALASYEQALKNTKEKGRSLLGIALVYEATLKPDEAEQYFQKAIQAGEDRARIDYGLFLFKQKRGEESIAMLERAGATAELERVRKSLAAASPKSETRIAQTSVTFKVTPLEMIVRNGATGNKHLVETMIAGVAVFDYDNDGWPDIYVANGAALPGLQKTGPSYFNRLFRNNRDGTFADVTTKAGVMGTGYSMGVAMGDFDNDGNIDLFVTSVKSNTLYRNRGDGTFEDVTEQAGLGEQGKWAVAAGWFDFDNDGLLDLFVVRYVVWDAAKEIFCGALPDTNLNRAGYRQYCHPSLYQPLANTLYRNLGNGKFRDVSKESGIGEKLGKGMGVAFGDFDGDGKLDIFVANDTVPNFLFHNEGNGTFRESALEAGVAYNADGKSISAMGADFRDVDNDGHEDLFVTALSDETFPLFRNLGNGSFADVTYPSGIGKAVIPWTGWSNGVFDFNNDGWKDLFVAGGHVMDNAEASSNRPSRQSSLVFLNKGRGRFDAERLPGEALHRGAAFGDFNRDGKVDVVVTRLNEPPLVLLNTSVAGNWIGFRLIGRKGNRDGIGAKLHLITNSGEQWNRVTTSVGYGSSSDRLVHFGLGKEQPVKSIEIQWPSGVIQRLENVSGNRYHEIREP